MRSQHREFQSLVSTKRWANYAAAGIASAVTLSTSENSVADFFYSGVLNQDLSAPATSNFRNTPLKTALSQNTIASFSHSLRSNGDGIALFQASGSIRGIHFPPNFDYAANLAASQVIAMGNFLAPSAIATLAFHDGLRGGQPGNSQFKNVGVGIVGWKFISPAEHTQHFAWARIQVSGISDNKMTLIDWAYSDQANFKTGQISAVPEPGSLGLLAAGAVGLAMWRLRRKSATADHDDPKAD